MLNFYYATAGFLTHESVVNGKDSHLMNPSLNLNVTLSFTRGNIKVHLIEKENYRAHQKQSHFPHQRPQTKVHDVKSISKSK